MMQTDRFHWLVILPFLAVLSMPAQAGRHDPMYIPEPIDVPAGVSAEIIRMAVRKALFDAGFTSRDIAAGHPGMRKEAVLMAYGYPPDHRTPSLDGDTWVYFKGLYVPFTLQFENGLTVKGLY